MNRILKAIGSSVLVALLVFSMACDNGSTSGGSGDNTGGNKQDGNNNQPSPVGEIGPGGGKIFYYSANGFTVYQNADDDTGITCHYLEVAPANSVEKLSWGAYGIDVDTQIELGYGKRNTARILVADPDAPAAKYCVEYRGGGKDDWFLASRQELLLLQRNKEAVGILKDPYLLSSCQYSLNRAYYAILTYETQLGNTSKNNYTGTDVRPIRAF